MTAYHTGLRRSNLLQLRWRDVDLIERTASVQQTKNGDPMVAALSQRVVGLLKKLPNQRPEAFVFEGRNGKPYDIRRLWSQVCKEAGLRPLRTW